jgi:(2Fe-2S) ferredoxin
MSAFTPQDIEKIHAAAKDSPGEYIKVGMSTCGIAAGADEVYKALVDEAAKRNISIRIAKCGCLGMCYAEPLVEVSVEGLPPIVYGRVTKEIALKIIEKHVCGKSIVNDAVFELEVR